MEIDASKKIEPLFIIGAQRSGTTLLRLILNNHSQVAIPEEGTFWMPLLRKYRNLESQKIIPAKDLQTHCSYIRKNTQFKLWNIDPEEYFTFVQKKSPISMGDFMSGLYSTYASVQNKSIWGDKTPSFFRMIPTLTKIFPQARFIHIIRDGRDVYLSMKKQDPSRKNIAVAALEWKVKVATVCNDFKKSRFDNTQHLEIRYEDLVEKPRETLEKITEFLQLDLEEQMFSFWQNSEKYINNQHSNLIFKPITTSSVYKWKDNISYENQKIFEVIAGECLNKYGYETNTISSRSIFSFYALVQLIFGLPFRAYQLIAVYIKLAIALKFGTKTKASGGK